MGRIINIQKFCTSDGPGIRTTVFFKGCPLRCLWCHNPESQSYKTEIAYNENLCIHCGRCVAKCPNQCHSIIDGKHVFSREKCTTCLSCINPACSAMEAYGYDITPEEIIKEVIKDKKFFDNSGGGITLSGGEPLAQPDFCLSLLKLAKENGLHVCMETCGFADQALLNDASRYVDMFLFDYKETNADKHKKFSGMDNSVILKNLRFLNEINKPVILRCPIVPNYNFSTEHFDGIANIANELDCILHVELEPYHSFGADKYSRLGRNKNALECIKPPTNSQMEEVLAYICKKTSKKVKID